MRIINFGSLNLDFVYKVEHFVQAGETISALAMDEYIGGKGLNQSVAAARAGAQVVHAGFIGSNGASLLEALNQAKVDTRFVKTIAGPSGHAMIQVNPEGENCIIIHGGANLAFNDAYIDEVLGFAEPGDVVLLQNETNEVAQIMRKAKAKGLKLVFNAAPANKAIETYPLELVDLFIINEVEGAQITGLVEPEAIFSQMHERFKDAAIVLTLGEMGARYIDKTQRISVPAQKVENVIDTTGAGDTFTGYFLCKWLEGCDIERCLTTAANAAALCIMKAGAANAIPFRHEVE